MILKAVKIGNSIGIILPKRECERMSMSVGDHISLTIRGKIEEEKK